MKKAMRIITLLWMANAILFFLTLVVLAGIYGQHSVFAWVNTWGFIWLSSTLGIILGYSIAYRKDLGDWISDFINN